MIEYHWINGWDASTDLWNQIDEIIAAQGWMSLNPNTTIIRLAIDNEKVIGFMVLQALPHVGPAFVDEAYRGQNVAETLADDMVKYFQAVGGRGFVVIADSAHSEKMCKDRGMRKLQSPVFITPIRGGPNTI